MLVLTRSSAPSPADDEWQQRAKMRNVDEGDPVWPVILFICIVILVFFILPNFFPARAGAEWQQPSPARWPLGRAARTLLMDRRRRQLGRWRRRVRRWIFWRWRIIRRRRRIGGLVMTDLISSADRDRIAASIRAAEMRTSGEILVLVARSASDYWAVPVLWAALLALAAPWPLIWLTAISAYAIFLFQLLLFTIMALVFSLQRKHRIALVPRFLRRRRARQMAREHFFTQGLHRTRDRTGVMIFVSVAERYAEVLADDAIAAQADEGVWRGIIITLIEALQNNRMGDGLVTAVEAAADILSQHAPPRADDTNELPDKVIII